MDVHEADFRELADLGLAKSDLSPLGRSGASEKRYYRIKGIEPKLVLVSTPETIALTVRSSTVARKQGIRSPGLIETYPERGIAIIEYVGDNHLRDFQSDPEVYARAYAVCLEILSAVPELTPTELVPDLTVDWIARDLALFRDEFRCRYVPGPGSANAEFGTLLEFAHSVGANTHLALGDVSPDNIMIKGDIADKESFVFIDIQDAFRAPFGFDIISLVNDVRSSRLPVPRNVIDSILTQRALCSEAGRSLYLLGIFRLLRIAGTFARLDRVAARLRYLQYIPHVARELSYCLRKLGCNRLSEAVNVDSWPTSVTRLSR